MIPVLLILTCLFLVGMLLNYWLGLLILILTMAYVIRQSSGQWDALVSLLIVSLPISYVGILGPLTHHVFSLFNIVLIVLITLFWIRGYTQKWYRLSVWEILAVLSFGLLFVLHLVQTHQFTLMNLFQMARWYLIVLAVYTIYKMPLSFVQQLNLKKYTDTYITVTLATAIALLVQLLLHQMLGIEVGNLSHFRLRVSYDVFFLAYSFLAIYLYSGALMAYMAFLRTKTKVYGVVTLLLLLLSILNSARSGLIVFMLIAGLYTIFKSGLGTAKKALLLLGLAAMFLVSMQLITLVRGNLFDPSQNLDDPIGQAEIVETAEVVGADPVGSRSLIDKWVYRFQQFFFDNDRFRILFDSLEIWARDSQTLLYGHSNLNEIPVLPHNFFVESLLTYGLFLGGWMIAVFVYLMINNWRSPYFALMLYMLVSSQLVTKIHLATWFIPLILLVRFWHVRQPTDCKD